MAISTAQQEQGTGAPSWRSRFDVTLQHLAFLKRKEEQLHTARLDAEAQLLHALAGAYAAGDVGAVELSAAYEDYRRVCAPGFRNRWDSALPISAARMKWALRDQPNGPHGSWFGTDPLGDGVAPRAGQCVVYVLFDASNTPCYVGSSEDFRHRLMNHRRDKEFVRWVAYPCQDRARAYELEDRLLKEHKPYLNKRAGR